jgi:hypothetical protein
LRPTMILIVLTVLLFSFITSFELSSVKLGVNRRNGGLAKIFPTSPYCNFCFSNAYSNSYSSLLMSQQYNEDRNERQLGAQELLFLTRPYNGDEPQVRDCHRERERKRERVCACVRVRVCVCACVRARLCVCVCVV